MPIGAVVLLSAAVGKAALRVFTEHGLTVHATELNADEVEEHPPHLAAKYDLPEELVQLQWRLLPVVLHPEPEYAGWVAEALAQLRDRDPEDAHALVLARALRLALGSNDRDFEGQAVERYTTARLLRELES